MNPNVNGNGENTELENVYQNEEQEDIKDTIGGYIHRYLPEAKIEYFT